MNPVSARSAPSAPDIGDATLGSGCGLLLLRLARASAWRLSRSLAESGLRWTDFAVLHHLEAQGPSSQRDLALALRIQPSNIVGLLDELERRRLLQRSPDPDDRRRHRVALTRQGHRTLERATNAARDAEADVLAPLSAAERRSFHAALVKLTAHTCDRGGFGGSGC